MQSAFHKIDRALSFDDQGLIEEAYLEYLSCIKIICDLLSYQSPHPLTLSSLHSTKLFLLLDQCSSRAKEIAESKSSSSSSLSKELPGHVGNGGGEEKEREKKEKVEEKRREELLNEPFRKAEMENEKLYRIHELKVNKLMQSMISPHQMQQEIAQLNLYLARQRTENYRIAKEEHNNLLKKIAEKETANQMHIESNAPPSSPSSFHSSHFHITIPRLVLQNSILSNLAKSLAEKVELKNGDKSFRNKMNQGEMGKKEAGEYLKGILSNPSHPLGKDVIEFVMNWKMESTKDQVSFQELKVKLKDFIYSMSTSILKHFKELQFFLDSVDGVTSYDDIVETFISPIVSNVVFPPVFGNLFELYKMRLEEKDKLYKEKLTTFQFVSPLQLGVERDLCLIEGDFENGMREEDDPYRYAIQKARTLSQLHSPLLKLDCLAQVNYIICETVKEHRPDLSFIGADHLLPLMCYVVIKANVPYLQSELSLLMDFTPDFEMLGERGYNLVTLQTCLQVIANLSNNQEDLHPCNEAVELIDPPKENQLPNHENLFRAWIDMKQP